MDFKFKDKIKRIFHIVNEEKAAMEYCYNHGFKSGKNFHYNSGYPIDSNWPWLISVGDNVTLATGAKLLAHDASTAPGCHYTKIGIVKLGNNVFIGCNSIVLCNVRIGDNVIVGAGSVVTDDLESNGVYAGNPAKFICSYDEYAKRHTKNVHKGGENIFFKPWYEWPDASEDMKNEMCSILENTGGYVK